MSGSSVFESVANWLREGQSLRRPLLEERQVLEARLEQIERLLAMLPPVEAVVADAAEQQPKRTAADAIREVLRANPEGLTARQVTEEIQRIMPLDDPHIVYATLSRLTGTNELVAEGERGQKVYRLKEVAEKAA